MRMRTLATAAATAAVVISGTAVPAQAALPEGAVAGADLPGAIPGRYIVTLKEPAAGQVSALSVDGGTTYVADMNATQARRLAADPDVRYVEQDRILTIQGTQKNPPWGLDRIDQRAVKGSKSYRPTDDGSSVHAYVLDTGIRVTHADFGGRASYGYDAITRSTDAGDCNGHGTHVAGTIGGQVFGVAKKVQLVAVRVLNCKGEGTLSQVISGVNWVTAHAVKPAVANMSMGGSYSASLNAAVQRSINSGVTYVVAAGNENVSAGKLSPAGLRAAITVGASDASDRRASFSNFGPALDLFAPGVNIRSDFYGSDYGTAVASGTSMASPHVAGAAALALDANPALTPAQVSAYLVRNATPSKVKDVKGSPDRLLFVPAPPAAPVITSSALTVTTGQAYTGKLSLKAARRGAWSVAAGRLPTGMTLWPSGSITGKPVAPGTATVTVRFTDYVPQAATRTLTVTVRKTAPVIATNWLPDGSAATYYSEQLTVADGRTGSWSVVSGALPDGLALGANGLIDGYPSNSSTFEVAFTDGWGTRTTQTLTITVA
ncbi:S8 family serine peptidase [Paractinoplanes abujensis]|uniref:Subtilisin family serine protease n=1 Tax=Paractinoplanes abujensis TaxID=882441 RepID=A0A7W7D0A1_9ACTN|nr:S8 family serine peptidase [Actinoplanes abujensis]MBB4697902.1 subtilisin family serine protease [Actinoplanes abujensis]